MFKAQVNICKWKKTRPLNSAGLQVNESGELKIYQLNFLNVSTKVKHADYPSYRLGSVRVKENRRLGKEPR